VHSVRGRKVQGVNRIGRLHLLSGRDVLHSSRGLRNLDMQRLPVKLQLACGERSFDELHLKRGVFWARWRPVYRRVFVWRVC
jgi:hypothetical protein